MRKAIIILNLCTICFLAVSCSSKDDENKAPSIVQLEYPTKDLLCIDHTISFNWSDAIDLENDAIEYTIIIAKDRQLTDVVENRTVSASELTVTLEKSVAYYWQVNAIDVDNNQESNSEIFSFYTKGDGVTNYAPFMADLQSPENNGNVTEGTVDLVWEASDINTADTLTYELFFGEDATLISIDNTLTIKSYSVSVVSGKTYSWQVNVTDNVGAKSIGQVFTFTVD
ncbi:hypothetical protein [Polaribacter sp. 11A2H]|uniref:hypothetical protein n=1 Tax=Polaribacter sp. 11A2H TaxID=2687290 RepID=UPI00140E248F|nr:hypothetical protein [Polaribacter sp. 11A2H]